MTADQLVTDSAHTYTHDGAGNMTARTLAGQAGPQVTYGWDSVNRLVTVTDAQRTITHTYDHAGRRATTTQGDSTATYLYDGWDLLNTVTDAGDTVYTSAGAGCWAPHRHWRRLLPPRRHRQHRREHRRLRQRHHP